METFPLRRWRARGPPVDVGDLSREIDQKTRKLRFVFRSAFVSLARQTGRHGWVCSCLGGIARTARNGPAQSFARSSAGPRIHYLDAPQTHPSSARLQRQQAGRGRLKPGARQAMQAQLWRPWILGLPLRNCHVSLASTPRSSAVNQVWRWGPVRSRLSSSSWSARRQIEFLVELKTSHT